MPASERQTALDEYLTAMLNELADLADTSDDPKLGDVGFKLRLLAMETRPQGPGLAH